MTVCGYNLAQDEYQVSVVAAAPIDNAPRDRDPWLLVAWILVALLFATQWYVYDGSRGTASPYVYYLGWSCLVWALAPVVIWFARRQPFSSQTWPRWLGLHLVASSALASVQSLGEALVKWERVAHAVPFQALASHYLLQHLQLYVVAYWGLVAVAEVLRMHDRATRHRLYTAELERRLSEAHLGVLRAQLRPHFLFNTLQTAVVLLRENPRAAEDTLLNLSALLRASLSDFQENEVPLRKELQFLRSYATIQQLRFGKRLQIRLCADQDTLDLSIPALILQPLVENAVKHGVEAHKGNDVVTVRAHQEHGLLTLEVQNCSSRLSATVEQLSTHGVGLVNTRERLRHLYGEQQSMELTNLQPCGVCVRLAFPAHQASVQEARGASRNRSDTYATSR